jgi:CubicO group peptidase (beta-lactamase class C family)
MKEEPARRLPFYRVLRALLALAFVAGGCAHHPAPADPAANASAARPATSAAPPGRTTAVYPGAEWERWPSVEAAGYSQEQIDAVLAKLKTTPTTALVAVVGGRVLFDYGDPTSVSYLASVRKSVLAMLYGNYVASGKIDLNKTLADLGIDDVGGLTDQEKQATIADLLSARSGVYHAASNSGDDLASAPPRGSQKHGTYYLYSNWDFNALGTIFEQETGRNIYDALETDIARPIGMQDFRRDQQRKSGDLTRSIHPAYHIYLSTRDMARVGYLMLREGAWEGRQLEPRDWIRKITSPVTRVWEMNPVARRSGRFGYGYLWWVFDGKAATGPYEGAYTGLGAIGQHITVLPRLDLVVAHKTAPNRNNLTVSHDQYLEFLDAIVAAHNPASGQ